MNRRALLSVHDKAGIVDLARGLVDLGWELVSSGGTARLLSDEGLPVTEVAETTGAPEILGGRVKTLHPVIHGGILADRSNPAHVADLQARGITPIDLVVGNLYPFRSDPSIELIDIGGPTMVRAAAKNHAHVGVVVDPSDYGPVLDELRAGGALSEDTRRRLARAAFAHTAAYDAAIVGWFDEALAEGAAAGGLPDSLHLALERVQDLRYGENPHQVGARYREAGRTGWWDDAIMHGGKAMSYLNLLDTEAAWRLVHSLGEEPTAVVVKHVNPCGAAVGGDIAEAYVAAHECDPISAFGGIVAVNRPVTQAMAEALTEVFTEVVVAPAYEAGALSHLQGRRNLRILEAHAPTWPAHAEHRRGPAGPDHRHARPGRLGPHRQVGLDRRHREVPVRRRVVRPRVRLACGGPGVVQHDCAGQGPSGGRNRRRPAEPSRRRKDRGRQGRWSGRRRGVRQRCVLPVQGRARRRCRGRGHSGDPARGLRP